MFCINPNFTSIPSYEQAARSWEKGIIFPKDRKLNNPTLPRGLIDTRKRHMTIERTPEDEYVLRLYGKATVIWHKDNSFTLCPHTTRSTAVFANRCTPCDVFVSICGTYFSATSGGRTYKVGDEVRFQRHPNGWEPDRITWWKIPFVNRERSAQAYREINYREFRLWFKTYVQMVAPPQELYSAWVSNEIIVTMLRDRKWRNMVMQHLPGSWSEPDRTLSRIRKAIHQEYNCIEYKKVPYLPIPGRKDHRNLLNLETDQ